MTSVSFAFYLFYLYRSIDRLIDISIYLSIYLSISLSFCGNFVFGCLLPPCTMYHAPVCTLVLLRLSHPVVRFNPLVEKFRVDFRGACGFGGFASRVRQRGRGRLSRLRLSRSSGLWASWASPPRSSGSTTPMERKGTATRSIRISHRAPSRRRASQCASSKASSSAARRYCSRSTSRARVT